MLQGGFNTGNDQQRLLRRAARHSGVDGAPARSRRPTRGATRRRDGSTRARRSARTRFRRSTCRSPARCAAIQGGQLAANWTAPNSATVGLNRPFAGLGGHDDHREPDRAGHALRRSRQPGRHAVREDAAVRPHAHDRRVRRLQHRELRRGADLQPDVRRRRPPRGCVRLVTTAVTSLSTLDVRCYRAPMLNA